MKFKNKRDKKDWEQDFKLNKQGLTKSELEEYEEDSLISRMILINKIKKWGWIIFRVLVVIVISIVLLSLLKK